MPKLTVEVDQATADAIRDAVVALNRVSYGYTLRAFATAAFAAELARLQDAHNDGQPFPPRAEALRRGPTVSS